ncbi:MAG: restriction endonuclease subunit S [Candidatus Hydrogenedentes bacterium]|nr:restriction endonuclease subunit S [Candidatus Hydrogenedentota bacterium]
MIEGLKPYPEYKESGLPWLEAIPKHWSMAPNRALMEEQRQVVGENASSYKLLSLTLRGIIARDMENPKGKFPAQFNTYKVVRPNDFVFCLFDIDETPRAVGISNQKGMITGAYDVFTPRRLINPRFLYHYYLFVDEGKLMKPFYTGLRKTIQRGIFASLKAPLPPLDEQAAIVRFLDHMNWKIDAFIRAKRKLIGLLKEQKQAIIHRAVTRGLNPDVPLKPSGVPWLGDIPRHWIVQRLGRISRIFNGSTPSRNKPSYWHCGTIPWLPSTRVNDYVVESATEFVTDQALQECSISIVPKGAVIVGLVGQGKTRGKSALLGINACINQNLAAIIPRSEVIGEYLLAFLTAFYSDLRELGRGGNQEALNCEIVANFRISIPTVEEQQRIVTSINFETRYTDMAIARTEREIAFMQEYRTRLTADIVTGKLDVREAAAKLPDLPTESPDTSAIEPIEDFDDADLAEVGG